MTYMSFLYRSFIVKCPYIEDYRFCKTKEVCFFPFRICGSIVCRDSLNCEVILKPHAYEDLYNLGVCGENSLYINTIKKFCRLPTDITKITCHFYPWEIVTQDGFVINDKSVFIPKDAMM